MDKVQIRSGEDGATYTAQVKLGKPDETGRIPRDQVDTIEISRDDGESFTLPYMVFAEIARVLPNPYFNLAAGS